MGPLLDPGLTQTTRHMNLLDSLGERSSNLSRVEVKDNGHDLALVMITTIVIVLIFGQGRFLTCFVVNGQWSMVMVMVIVILPIGFRYNQENHDNG